MKKVVRYNQPGVNCSTCASATPHYSYGLAKIDGGDKKVLFILDYYSQSQQNKGMFEGNTGGLLKQVIDELNIDVNSVAFTPAIKCVGAKPTLMKELKGFHLELLEDVKKIMPSKIICFGKMALNCLTLMSLSIKEYRSIPIELGEITIYSTFSLFQVNNDPSAIKDILSDVSKALGAAKVPRDTKVARNSLFSIGFIDGVKNKGYFALDVETTSLNSFGAKEKLLTIGVSNNEGEAFVYSMQNDDMQSILYKNELRALLDKGLLMIGHNIKFDYLWVRNKFDRNLDVELCDTLIMYIILDENSKANDLKYLSSQLTDMVDNYAVDVDTKNLANMPFDKLAQYNGRDVDATLRLFNVLMPEIERQGKLSLLNFLNTALKTIAHIELNGLLVDKTWLKTVGEEIKKDYIDIENSYKMVYPNLKISSHPQLAHILYNELKLPIIEETGKGNPSTSKDTLKILLEDHCENDIQAKFLTDLLKYSKAKKIHSTYFEGLSEFIQDDGCIHTSYNLGRNSTSKGSSGTVTGRLSSSNPNMTNIPRDPRVKGIFIPRPGYLFLDADYSQLELRVGAWYAKEQKMYDLFNKKEDIHTSVLAQIVKMKYEDCKAILEDEGHKDYAFLKETRVIAKSINFGIFYGAGANTIQTQARQAGLKISKNDAQDMINKWLKAYPSVAKWIIRTSNQIQKDQEISSPTGRTRHLPGANRNDPVGFALIRQGINFPIQTLASEICLAALIQIEKMIDEKGYDARIVLTVHDSVLVEFSDKIDCNKFKDDIHLAMINKTVDYFKHQFNFYIDVPIEISVKINKRWGQKD